MKLEVGMYVRTKDKIVEIEKISDGVMWDTQGHVHFGDFIKASHNIIDLIEENDVVVIRQNGDLYKYEVFSVPVFSEQKLYVYENVLGKTTMLFLEDIPKEYIVSIVTKEQFEGLMYKVGE